MTPHQTDKVIRQPAMLNALKTHCKNGHELAGDNLRIKTHHGRPARQCKTCIRKTRRDAKRADIISAHPNGPDPELVWSDILPVDVWKRIQVDANGCWIWTGSKGRQGYGRTTHGDGSTKYTGTHRLTYMRIVGAVPEGLELDHLCRVRSCCNPEHLEPVTHRENMLRGETVFAFNAKKTHCRHGHELSGDNLMPTTRNERACRTCVTSRRKARYAASRAAA